MLLNNSAEMETFEPIPQWLIHLFISISTVWCLTTFINSPTNLTSRMVYYDTKLGWEPEALVCFPCLEMLACVFCNLKIGCFLSHRQCMKWNLNLFPETGKSWVLSLLFELLWTTAMNRVPTVLGAGQNQNKRVVMDISSFESKTKKTQQIDVDRWGSSRKL